ncbi:hypothetical protein KFK09_022729 [Dendrobium nobile]|uniref:Reverse transcriptase domain-containing protein n=1 Tax=Dendrobium nobile TaxID=94219 RepID=A0A8T3AJI8_DENNO|nr:hypothetical protein KFK09_022729 [Dendrobium nobile]
MGASKQTVVKENETIKKENAIMLEKPVEDSVMKEINEVNSNKSGFKTGNILCKSNKFEVLSSLREEGEIVVNEAEGSALDNLLENPTTEGVMEIAVDVNQLEDQFSLEEEGSNKVRRKGSKQLKGLGPIKLNMRSRKMEGARKSKASLYAREFIRENDMFFLGLVESKISVVDKKTVSSLVGKGWDYCHVPSEGLSGGILVIWRQDLANFSMLGNSSQLLIGDLNIINKGTWRIATIYGSKDVYRRRRLWEDLEQFMTVYFPMVLGGDFNCLLSKEEKKGGRNFVFGLGPREMKSFITCNDLHEVACIGPKYTWCNNKRGADRILEKLDRCLVNANAFNSSHRLLVKHLTRLASDHCPIMLRLLNFIPPIKKILKFEEVWTSIPASVAVVNNSWNKNTRGDPSQILNLKLKRSLRDLYYWSKAKFKALNVQKEELKTEVHRLQELEAESGFLSEEDQWFLRAKMEELNIILAQLSTWWRQRAKLKWMVDGDSNSKFFQAYGSARRNSNYIHKIKNVQGEMIEDQKEIEDVIYRYFGNKWEERCCNLEGWPATMSSLNEEDRRMIDKEFTFDELEMVIKELKKNIAPGQDVDMEQAYDSMGWTALVKIFDYFGFPIKLANLVVECIIDPKFSIIINGSFSRMIEAKSGFRQGCPLSPFLFVMCAQLLSNAFHQKGNSIGVGIFSNGPKFIIDKAMSMLGVWGNKLISLAGRITLANSILLSYPSFHSSHSMVPKQTLYEVDKLCRKFIWNKNDGSAGMHYVSWELMCKPRSCGGLRINYCSKKAGPLRARLAWRYNQFKDSLLHKVMFPKYGAIMKESSVAGKYSSTWKLLCNCCKYLKPIIRWSVSNGNDIKTYEDNWILDKSLLLWPTFVNPNNEGNLTVNCFISDGNWNVEKLRRFFGEDLINLIISIKIRNEMNNDQLELIHLFSSKTITALAAEALLDDKTEQFYWNWFRRTKLCPKIEICMFMKVKVFQLLILSWYDVSMDNIPPYFIKLLKKESDDCIGEREIYILKLELQWEDIYKKSYLKLNPYIDDEERSHPLTFRVGAYIMQVPSFGSSPSQLSSSLCFKCCGHEQLDVSVQLKLGTDQLGHLDREKQ